MPRVLFLRKYHKATARMAIPAMPPTTPPTIAPIGVEVVVVMGTLDGVDVGVGTLREVPTPELDPPAVGVMRKKSRMN